MKKILLTGENGFLGKNIKRILKNKKFHIIEKPKNQKKYTIDLRNPDKVKKFLFLTKPDLIINTAVKAGIAKIFPKNNCPLACLATNGSTLRNSFINSGINKFIIGVLLQARFVIFTGDLTKNINLFARGEVEVKRFIESANCPTI